MTPNLTPSMLIANMRANAQQPIDKADLSDMYENYDALLDIADAAIAYVEDAEHEDDCRYCGPMRAAIHRLTEAAK